MGELTTKKQNLPKKEAIGQYVHDMLDLEIRAHSLRKTAEETRKEAYDKEKNATNRLSWCQFGKKRCFDNLVSAKQKKISSEPIAQSLPWLLLSIPLTGLAAVYGFVLFESTEAFVEFMILGIFISCMIALIRYLVLRSREESWIDSTVYQKNEELKKAKESLAEAQKEYDEIMPYVQKLRSHADQLDKDIAEIEKSLQHNYALNIVPPDYRRLECLLWIDYAFRNDQVDTMREATLQCDKWTRHEVQMQVLNELARNFRSIRELLETMNTNISMMNQDLFRIAEAQEKQLSETQSARYAMESVKQSTERLEFYEEMKRHGTF